MSAVRCNVNVSRYDGDVMFGYECVRAGRCKFGLYPSMPPDFDMVCAFYQGGSCLQQAAHIAALEDLKHAITAEIKRIKSGDEEAS